MTAESKSDLNRAYRTKTLNTAREKRIILRNIPQRLVEQRIAIGYEYRQTDRLLATIAGTTTVIITIITMAITRTSETTTIGATITTTETATKASDEWKSLLSSTTTRDFITLP